MEHARENNKTSAAGLSVSGLSAGYGRKQVLKEVSFNVGAGETVGLIGENGCGKSTLLKALTGILPSHGDIRLNGQDLCRLSVKERAFCTAYIPQRSGITISVSVLDAVLMGFNPELPLLSYPTAAMKEKAFRALDSVGLGERASEDLQTLSEGQKQLVMLARTFAAKRQLLLLDEPESALDFGARYRMTDLIGNYASKRSASVLITLHDPVLALNVCDRLLLMKDGRIIDGVFPAADDNLCIGEKLRRIYGPLTVHSIADGSGHEKKVLIREEV